MVRARRSANLPNLEKIFVWSTVKRKITKHKSSEQFQWPREKSGVREHRVLPNNEKTSACASRYACIHPPNHIRLKSIESNQVHSDLQPSHPPLPNQLNPLPNRPLKMPIAITGNQALAPPTPALTSSTTSYHSAFSRNLIDEIPHCNPLGPLDGFAPTTPPAPHQVQRRARRLAEVHAAPGSGWVGCGWIGSGWWWCCGWMSFHSTSSRSSTSYYRPSRKRNTDVPPPHLRSWSAGHHIFPRRRQVDQHRRDGRVDSGKGAEQQAVVLRSAVGGRCPCRGVQVCYGRGWEVWVRGEEEGALEFG